MKQYEWVIRVITDDGNGGVIDIAMLSEEELDGFNIHTKFFADNVVFNIEKVLVDDGDKTNHE